MTDIEPPAERVAERPQRALTGEALVGPLAAFGMLVAVGGTQGGYFPEMWGPSAVILLAILCVWALASGRLDVGRVDLAWLGVLTATTAWIALSLVWSAAPGLTSLEVQRAVMVLTGFAVILVLARSASAPFLTLALALGATALAGYGLATRLLPGELGTTFEPITGYRLAEPIGYWNGLGVVAALGIVLALGAAAELEVVWARVAGAVALVVLAPTLYFTFSRAAWVALGFAVAATLVVSSRRLATLGAWGLLLVVPVVSVAAASHYPALRRTDGTLDAATTEGRRLLLVLVLLAGLAALGGIALHLLAARVDVGEPGRRVLGGIALVALAFVVAAGIARFGAPWSAAGDAIDAFQEENAIGITNLNDRLFTLSGSGRIDLWQAAADLGADNALVGAGAGTFERHWQASPHWSLKARDAHSIFLESWAELGVVGLALVVALFVIPGVACVRLRRSPTVAAAFGALVGFAVHAAVDWDWEFPAITLLGFGAGLVGVVALREGRVRRVGRPVRAAAVAGGVVVAAVCAVAYVGNDAQRRAQYALDVGRPSVALSEARLAERFSPWSPYPDTVAGEAQLALRRVAAARVSFREAIATDPGYWRAWLGLAVASEGAARTRALREATRLYPRSVEIEDTKELLAQRP